jgi:predicted ATPase
LPREHDTFLRTVQLREDKPSPGDQYPFSMPAIRKLGTLAIDPGVTLFIGENGSGKSTLLEAIAVASGFNPEGGSRNFRFLTRSSESKLWNHLLLTRGTRKPRTGYFFRAESFFSVATEIERLDSEPGGGPPTIQPYGGKSLRESSHGESFLTLAQNRFGPNGLYLLDEPEAALSPSRQLALLVRIHDLVHQKSQFLIATNSPILLAYPNALLYELSDLGIQQVAYEETEHFRLTRDFLLDRERFFRELFEERKEPTEQ